MSRTNPYKKKRRSAKRTLLTYGEGLGEEMFLKYIRSLYARDSGVSVTIRNGKGGTPNNVVMEAVKEIGDFDVKVVVIDNDKGKTQMNDARQTAKDHGIILVEHTPCLEALFLSILEPNLSITGKKSAWCKKYFEQKYIGADKRRELRQYTQHFPKNLLNDMRTTIAELNEIISYFENKN